MRYVFTKNLKDVDNFADYNETHNKSLYTLKYLIQKLNKDHKRILNTKLLSVEYIKDKLELPLDYFSVVNKEPAKILNLLSNCWLLSDLSKDVFGKLQNYESAFGECFNKLRLMLDFASICFR